MHAGDTLAYQIHLSEAMLFPLVFYIPLAEVPRCLATDLQSTHGSALIVAQLAIQNTKINQLINIILSTPLQNFHTLKIDTLPAI